VAQQGSCILIACWLDVAACVAHALCRLMQINMAVIEVHLQSYMLHACTAVELASHFTAASDFFKSVGR
jgi:hypothetical protein